MAAKFGDVQYCAAILFMFDSNEHPYAQKHKNVAKKSVGANSKEGKKERREKAEIIIIKTS